MFLGFALMMVGCARPAHLQERPAPAVVDPAERAADGLRDRLTAFDAAGCAREGEALVRQYPDSGRLRAWWIGCVSASGRNLEAESLAAAMLSEKPGDPWAELAAVLMAAGQSQVIDPGVLGRSQALLETLPVRRDAVIGRAWLLVRMRRGEAVLELARAEPETPASARVYALLEASRADPRRLLEALSVANGVRRDEAEFVAVAGTAAAMLGRFERPVEALAWAEAGLEQAPASVELLYQRWRLTPLQPGAGEVVEDVLEDIEGTVAILGDRPEVLQAAIEGMRAIGRPGSAAPLEARLLAEFPDSPQAESILYRRLDQRDRPGASNDPEVALLRDTMLAAFLARARHHDPRKVANVARWRFEATIADPAAQPEAIQAAVEEMIARDPSMPTPKLVGARVLAKRTPFAARAEELVRAGLEQSERWAAAWSAAGSLAIDMARRDHASGANTTLGELALKAGRLEEAQAAFRRAEREALAPYADLQVGLAAVAQKRGDFEAAELYLLAGVDLHGEDGERCRGALTELYRARTGSARGLAEYMADIAARSQEQRRRHVLGGYDESASTVPDFALRDMQGRVVTLSSLRGKLVVLHFWFKTCAGCLLEMPEFSAFAAAHADDPDVAVVSVHYGSTLGEVSAWVRERQLQFPVLMDDGWSERNGVASFPTTWFLDAEGRRRFDNGFAGSRYLREEFEWRVEALRAKAGRSVSSG